MDIAIHICPTLYKYIYKKRENNADQKEEQAGK